MAPIRTALLIRRHKGSLSRLVTFLVAGISALSFLTFPEFVQSQDVISFSDLPQDSMYRSYIQRFQEANIIVGDTQGGSPIGKLRPNDPINRAEFSKITALVKLMEQKQGEGDVKSYQHLDLNAFTLKTNEDFLPYYQAQLGDPQFKDVADKAESCAQDPAGCEPWFTQFVNYVAHLGLIKGYPDGHFYPEQNILRIHALKLIMAYDGNLPADQDPKFKALSADPRIEKVLTPKCLRGAEPYILAANGGYSQDSYNLLSYAILADKLDLFGNQCQLFTQNNATTPKQRAELLQKPLTRQEIARYFALTSTYDFLQTDHSVDTTTSTEEENGLTFYDEAYDPNVFTVDLSELAQADQQEVGEEANEIPNLQLNPLPTAQERALMSVAQLATLHPEGRCCSAMSLTSDCPVVLFKDYTIAENSSYNYQNYDGGLWQKATGQGQVCWVPFVDLLEGYGVLSLDSCDLKADERALVNQYLNVYFKMEVTRIWTSTESNSLKFYRQLSLDLAMKRALEIDKQLKASSANCILVKNKLSELQKAHEGLYH